MIYAICGIGIILVICVMVFGLADLARPMPTPPEGSYAEYLTDEERLGVQCEADWRSAMELAKERGWNAPA